MSAECLLAQKVVSPSGLLSHARRSLPFRIYLPLLFLFVSNFPCHSSIADLHLSFPRLHPPTASTYHTYVYGTVCKTAQQLRCRLDLGLNKIQLTFELFIVYIFSMHLAFHPYSCNFLRSHEGESFRNLSLFVTLRRYGPINYNQSIINTLLRDVLTQREQELRH